ncbi:hypothetical protein UA16_03326 [Burkholderia multivorans]|nr:hypothetical protein UA16_03326 [Burkholderia multivorans]
MLPFRTGTVAMRCIFALGRRLCTSLVSTTKKPLSPVALASFSGGAPMPTAAPPFPDATKYARVPSWLTDRPCEKLPMPSSGRLIAEIIFGRVGTVRSIA